MPSNKIENLIKVLAVLLACIIILVAVCFAAGGVGVDPTIVETLAERETVTTGTLTVVNNEQYPVSVTVKLENWLKRKGFDNNLSAMAPEDWVKIEPSKFEIKARSAKKVNYILNIPEGLKGELVAMAYFAPVSMTKSSMLRSRIGVCIYAGIKGTEKIQAKISETVILPDDKEGKKGLGFITKLENSGNVHIRPVGKVIVLQEGKTIKEIDFQKGFPIYPGKTHSYSVYWKNADLPVGVYTARAVFEYGTIYGDTKETKGKDTEFISVK
ncbi:MAG: hypothetical protein ABIH89_07430 [Elusimicrobiota bacterium]